MTSSVIGAISPQLERAEIERAQRKPTGNLQAYDYYLRALASFYKFTREAHLEALKLTEIASGIDPEFAAAYALGARCYVQRKAFGWSTDASQERVEARRSQGGRSNSIRTIHRCLHWPDMRSLS